MQTEEKSERARAKREEEPDGVVAFQHSKQQQRSNPSLQRQEYLRILRSNSTWEKAEIFLTNERTNERVELFVFEIESTRVLLQAS